MLKKTVLKRRVELDSIPTLRNDLRGVGEVGALALVKHHYS